LDEGCSVTAQPVALVLTPVAAAPALAGLCAISGIDAHVVPTSSGAVAGLELASTTSQESDGETSADWDIAELLGGVEAVPTEADNLARRLSELLRSSVVLLSATLSPGEGEGELAGQLAARRYTEGEAGDELAVGLVLAGADDL